jgi:hypothetical protein
VIKRPICLQQSCCPYSCVLVTWIVSIVSDILIMCGILETCLSIREVFELTISQPLPLYLLNIKFKLSIFFLVNF